MKTKRMTAERFEELTAFASQVGEADRDEYAELILELKRARDREEELGGEASTNGAFPEDCLDGGCLRCEKCYQEYVAAKMAGELDF